MKDITMIKVLQFFLMVTIILFHLKHNNLRATVALAPSLHVVKPPENSLIWKTFRSSTINSTDISVNSDIHLLCNGEQPILWRYPDKILKERSSINFPCKNSKHPFCSELLLHNATYEDTGVYTCYYGNGNTGSAETSIYFFLNDPLNLFVPYKKNSSFIPLTVIRSHPVRIPCLPTSSNINVTLLEKRPDTEPRIINEEKGETFDPTIGFDSILIKANTTELECLATLNSIEKKISVKIVKSHGIRLKINTDKSKFVMINGKFELTCIVQYEVNKIISVNWNYPCESAEKAYITSGHKDGRIFLDKTVSDKNCRGAYCSETLELKLTATKVKLQDEGIYRCYIYDSLGYNNSESVYIRVHNDTVSSSISFLAVRNQTYFHLNVGEELRLAVDYEVASPTQLFWYKNDIFLGEADKDNSGQDSTNSSTILKIFNNQAVLTIAKLTMKDIGVYTLKGLMLNIEKKISIMVEVKGKPLVEITSHLRFFSLSGSYKIDCRAISSPRPTIHWSFFPCDPSLCDKLYEADEELIIQQNYTAIREPVQESTLSNNREYSHFLQPFMDESTLNIINASRSGIYKCHGTNIIGSTYAYSKSILTSAGPTGFDIRMNKSEVVEKDDVAIACYASLYLYTKTDWNRKLSKSFAFETLQYKTDQFKITNSIQDNATLISTLLIFRINASDSGDYFCNATLRNIENDDTAVRMSSANYQEKVISVLPVIPPRFKSIDMENKTYKVSERKHSVFSCYFEGRPKPTIEWFKNEQKLTTNLSGVEIADDGQLLIMHRMLVGDSGKYRCKISNRAGEESAESWLIVNDAPNLFKITIVVSFCMLAFFLMVTAIFLYKKLIEIHKRQKDFFMNNLFNASTFEPFNPQLPFDEQLDLFSYDTRWEFPANRLKMLQTLGEGAFGRVMLAEAIGIVDSDDTQLVAVKMLKPNSDYAQKKALIAELKILTYLGRHLNIVNCLGCVTKNMKWDKLMLIVEYCPYGNLRDYLIERRSGLDEQNDQSKISGERLNANSDTARMSIPDFKSEALKEGSRLNSTHPPLSQVLSIRFDNNPNNLTDYNFAPLNYLFADKNIRDRKEPVEADFHAVSTNNLIAYGFQISRGMEYLEQKKLLHRDLAARNILVADKGVVKICDFGLAKNIQACDNYILKADTPLPIKWMAIESIGDKIFTSKSDVWSFGVLLWEIFTFGRTPYPGLPTDKSFYEQLVNGYRMEKPEKCPKIVYDVMIDCWRADPVHRPSFSQLVKSLGSLIEDSVRNYYLELSYPYESANKVMNSDEAETSSYEEHNYLSMSGATNHYEFMGAVSGSLKPFNHYDTVRSLTPGHDKPMEIIPMIHFDYVPEID